MKVWPNLLGIISFLSLLSLATLTKFHPSYFSWDLQISQNLQAIHAPIFNDLMLWVSYWGFPPQVFYLTIVVIIALLIIRKYWAATCQAFVSLGVGWLGYSFKFLVNRPRPDPNLLNVVNKGLEGGYFSFPAGHVESFVAIFGFVAFLFLTSRKLNSFLRNLFAFPFILLIILIGPSRIYMGEHWPSDVLGGYLVGLVWLLIAIKLYSFGRIHWQKKFPKFIGVVR